MEQVGDNWLTIFSQSFRHYISPTSQGNDIKLRTRKENPAEIDYWHDKEDYEFTEYDKIITQTQNEFSQFHVKLKELMNRWGIANQQLENSRAQLAENQISIRVLKEMR